jgi:small subunit ribosomal protein S16
MAVHIRLSRAGAKKKPFYRVVVADHHRARDRRFIENIGTYDPRREPAEFHVDEARLAHWRSKGALPSATVSRLLRRQPVPAPGGDAK